MSSHTLSSTHWWAAGPRDLHPLSLSWAFRYLNVRQRRNKNSHGITQHSAFNFTLKERGKLIYQKPSSCCIGKILKNIRMALWLLTVQFLVPVFFENQSILGHMHFSIQHFYLLLKNLGCLSDLLDSFNMLIHVYACTNCSTISWNAATSGIENRNCSSI